MASCLEPLPPHQLAGLSNQNPRPPVPSFPLPDCRLRARIVSKTIENNSVEMRENRSLPKAFKSSLGTQDFASQILPVSRFKAFDLPRDFQGIGFGDRRKIKPEFITHPCALLECSETGDFFRTGHNSFARRQAG